MIVVALIPLFAWWMAPHWLRPILAGLGGLLVVAAGLRWLRLVRRDRASMLHDPGQGSWRWHEAWAAPEYGRRMMSWLRQHDWRITAAHALDADRLLLAGQTGRQQVALLCIRPGLAARPEDLARLEQDRRGLGRTALAVLVSDAPAGTTGPMQVRFADMLKLGEDLASDGQAG